MPKYVTETQLSAFKDAVVTGINGRVKKSGDTTITGKLSASAFELTGSPSAVLERAYSKRLGPFTTPPAGSYYELWTVAASAGGASLQGEFFLDVEVGQGGYGVLQSCSLPVSYNNDWLHYSPEVNKVTGYGASTNPFANGAWVTLTPTTFTGRHLLLTLAGVSVQARVVANAVSFRLLVGAGGLANAPDFTCTLRHSGEFRNHTVTDLTGTGTDTATFKTLPNFQLVQPLVAKPTMIGQSPRIDAYNKDTGLCVVDGRNVGHTGWREMVGAMLWGPLINTATTSFQMKRDRDMVLYRGAIFRNDGTTNTIVNILDGTQTMASALPVGFRPAYTSVHAVLEVPLTYRGSNGGSSIWHFSYAPNAWLWPIGATSMRFMFALPTEDAFPNGTTLPGAQDTMRYQLTA